MKLPNIEKALISPEKLRDYLLSPSHPVGQFKAAFFRSFGYTQKEWKQLELDIRTILQNDAEKKDNIPYGQKFIIRGNITGPSNKVTEIVTVWIILNNEDFPRFITAYPGDKNENIDS